MRYTDGGEVVARAPLEVLGLHVEQTRCLPAGSAGQTDAANDGDRPPIGRQPNPPAEERHQITPWILIVVFDQANLKCGRAFEKELALLGKELAEA